MIKKILKKLYINSDNQNYDEKHLGTFNFWRLLFYNLIFPGRTLNRIKFGQTFKNKKNIVKNFNSYQYQSNKNCSKIELSSALENLCSNGGCVIKNYFPESVINNFIDENKELIKNLKSYESNHIDYKIETLKLSLLVGSSANMQTTSPFVSSLTAVSITLISSIPTAALTEVGILTWAFNATRFALASSTVKSISAFLSKNDQKKFVA